MSTEKFSHFLNKCGSSLIGLNGYVPIDTEYSENTLFHKCGILNFLSLRLLVCPFQMLLEMVKVKTQPKKLQCLIIRYIVQFHSFIRSTGSPSLHHWRALRIQTCLKTKSYNTFKYLFSMAACNAILLALKGHCCTSNELLHFSSNASLGCLYILYFRRTPSMFVKEQLL